MKKLILLAAIALAFSCNGPKDPPDENGIIITGSGISVDTMTITTNARLQKVIDSLEANK